MLKAAKLDRINHTYYLGGKVVKATKWYSIVKNWIWVADQNSITILKQDNERCLLYEIDSQLLLTPTK